MPMRAVLNPMMELIGAIIAQAAIDYVDQRSRTGGALDAGVFLDAAGMLDRAPLIAAYSWTT